MSDSALLQGMALRTYPSLGLAYTVVDYSLDGVNDKVCVAFGVPEDCSITGMACWPDRVQGTAPFYVMNLQGLDATAAGKPDGVIKESGDCETAAWQPVAGARYEASFDTPYAATKGELLAGVIEYSSGTIEWTNRVDFNYGAQYASYVEFPYAATTWNGTTWSHIDYYYPVLTLTTDQDYDLGGVFVGGGATTLSTTTEGHRFCMKMTLPADENLEIHISGFQYSGKVAAAATAWKAGLWDTDGAELASTDATMYSLASTPAERDSQMYYFDDAATLVSGTSYYIGFERTASNLTTTYMNVGHVDGLRSWPGGTAFYGATWNGSAWTDQNTWRPLINLLLSDIHGTAGGGGSTTRPTMGVIG